ncbi:hypothetical protein BDY24DRAFT_405240 [Mrakia frigida]|uniref:Swc5p n=1 Tax=Mrakia frigida TaxID=29902 RepID=UPI003FCBF42F
MAPPPPPLPATLFSADLPSEDEADDEDFTPPSPTSSTTSSNAPSSKKRRKLSHSPPPTTSEDVVPEAFSYADLVASAEQVEKGDELGEEEKKAREVKMVKITVERKFAGEVVLVELTVPETSPEAQAFFASSTTLNPATIPSNPTVPSPSPSSLASLPLSTTSSATTSNPSAPPPPPARAPPRKRRTSALETASAAPKLKKMTTMEKSALDWKAASSQLDEAERDELDRNRRKGGAGFLEKMDFLGRVGERTEGGGAGSSAGRRGGT